MSVHAYDDAKARRNAMVLAVAQALYGAVTTALVVTAGLVGTQLAPSPFWSTMPMTMMIVGSASTTYPSSLLMRRIGRRGGPFARHDVAQRLGGHSRSISTAIRPSSFAAASDKRGESSPRSA